MRPARLRARVQRARRAVRRTGVRERGRARGGRVPRRRARHHARRVGVLSHHGRVVRRRGRRLRRVRWAKAAMQDADASYAEEFWRTSAVAAIRDAPAGRRAVSRSGRGVDRAFGRVGDVRAG